MRSLHSYKKQKGFTIVELLIVIVVIGILATLVIVTFSGIQRRARDNERQTDINAVQSHVEAFYAEHGYYPTVIDVTSPTFRAEHMKGFKEEALFPPNSTNQIDAQASSTTKYSYVVSASTPGGSCDNTIASDDSTNNGCDKYVIEAELEAKSGEKYTKTSE